MAQAAVSRPEFADAFKLLRDRQIRVRKVYRVEPDEILFVDSMGRAQVAHLRVEMDAEKDTTKVLVNVVDDLKWSI